MRYKLGVVNSIKIHQQVCNLHLKLRIPLHLSSCNIDIAVVVVRLLNNIPFGNRQRIFLCQYHLKNKQILKPRNVLHTSVFHHLCPICRGIFTPSGIRSKHYTHRGVNKHQVICIYGNVKTTHIIKSLLCPVRPFTWIQTH